MQATANAWLTGLEHWNVEELVAPRADDCLHEIYPTTMGIPPSSNEDFRAFFEPLKIFQGTKVGRLSPESCSVITSHLAALLSLQQVKVHAQVFDPQARSFWVHLDMWAVTPVGPFHNEFVFMLFFNEQGDKIVRIREMMDSLYSQDFFAKMAAHGT